MLIRILPAIGLVILLILLAFAASAVLLDHNSFQKMSETDLALAYSCGFRDSAAQASGVGFSKIEDCQNDRELAVQHGFSSAGGR